MATVVCGGYGRVTVDNTSPVVKKVTKLLENGELMSPNLNEAVLTSYFNHHSLPNVVTYHKACVNGSYIEIESERAQHGDLSSYIKKTPFLDRMLVVEKMFMGVLKAVHFMHEHGIIHGDLKPNNVVVTNDSVDNFEVKVIDFGAGQMFKRSPKQPHNKICTYPYAPPEMFEDGEPMWVHTDAYSLGALLHNFIYKTNLYNWDDFPTFESVAYLHRTGGAQCPVDCPAGVPPHMFEIMKGLLNKDPSKRTTIAELYNKMASPIEIVEPATRFLDPPSISSWKGGRDAAIDYISDRAPDGESLALACNVADRFVAASGRPCSTVEQDACLIAVCSVLNGDDARISHAERVALGEIMNTLKFDIVCDTCDVILLAQHQFLDMVMLGTAIKDSDGSTMDIVRTYNAYAQAARKRQRVM